MKKVIINTRPLHQAEELTQKLLNLGLEVLELPLLSIEASPVLEYLPKVIEQLSGGDFLVYTSANGVRISLEYLKNYYHESFFERLSKFNFAAIGGKTKLSIEDMGFKVQFIPKQSDSISFATELAILLKDENAQVLSLRGQLASKEFSSYLKRCKIEAKDFTVYHSKRRELKKEEESIINNLLENKGEKYIIIFTSAEAARHFIDLALKAAINLGVKLNQRISEFDFVVIGRETAKALQDYMIKPKVVCDKQDINEVVERISIL